MGYVQKNFMVRNVMKSKFSGNSKLCYTRLLAWHDMPSTGFSALPLPGVEVEVFEIL
jgi:hypothetical protein